MPRAWLIATVLLAGCGPTGIIYATVPDDLAIGGEQQLRLDLAEPDPAVHGEGPYPAVVFIHGGGWEAGSKNAYATEIQDAARPRLRGDQRRLSADLRRRRRGRHPPPVAGPGSRT